MEALINMSLISRSVLVASALGFACVVGGCQTTSAGDAAAFREAVPQKDDVAIGVPGAQSTNLSTKSLHLRDNGDTGAASSAKYYGLTRELTGGVDYATGTILSSIWTVVSIDPTSLETDKAVWGPGSADALDPAVWRFTVTKVGDAEYDYVLEGQPSAGGAWVSALNGHGYGVSSAQHRQGWFSVDNDAYNKLESSSDSSAGTTKVTYDLRQIPATIDVELRPGGKDGSLDVNVTHQAGGAGTVELKGTTNVDDQAITIDLLSQWNASGAGRADASLSGGELPGTVTIEECWSSSFQRAYYTDSVNAEPTSGEASACAFQTAKM